jgi:hypothetical protein
MSQGLFQVLRLASTMLGNILLHWTKPGLIFQIIFDRIWLPHDELPPSFPKQEIAGQKLMALVVWNPYGFHVIQSLPKGIKWTGRYYSDNIFSEIAALRYVGSHRK